MNLYHYCPPEAFLSILRTHTFRCSALSLSNDTMEGKWIREIFSEICDDREQKDYHKDYVIGVLEIWLRIFEMFGFCLSKLDDSLNQWRGYAQNGEGFCIGFSKKHLKEIPPAEHDFEKPLFILMEVQYQRDLQKQDLMPAFLEIQKILDDAFRHLELPSEEYAKITKEQKKILEVKALRDLELRIPKILLPKAFQYKHPAFEEEKEWRVVSPFDKERAYNIAFRSVGNRIVPYRPFKFSREMVTEVILGPKNQTPKEIIEVVLKKFGYNDVEIRKSEAPYR